MARIQTQYPEWLDRREYPFASRWVSVEGGRLHYVDEGDGRPVVLVHGTPSWSFLYRHLVRCLAPRWRTVVPDHLGFGLSEKPARWLYRPVDHARNLETLIDHLGLRDITLVVHDFGGPIGLAYAVKHPDNVRSLVLFNTWLWSLQGQLRYELGDRVFASPLGRLAYLRVNVSPRFLVPLAFGDRRRLTEEVHGQYTAPFPQASDRQGMWTLAQEFTRSGRWFDSLWRRRDAFAHKPALVLWGMRDRFMPPAFLARWEAELEGPLVRRFPNAGHFLQEEEPEAVCCEVRRFLRQTEASGQDLDEPAQDHGIVGQQRSPRSPAGPGRPARPVARRFSPTPAPGRTNREV